MSNKGNNHQSCNKWMDGWMDERLDENCSMKGLPFSMYRGIEKWQNYEVKMFVSL